MKVCPNCSTEFEDEINFCRRDGAALKPKAEGEACPKCGKAVEVGKAFCRHCGASLASAKQPERNESEIRPVPMKREPEEFKGETQSGLQAAGEWLQKGNYKEAISALENHLKTSSDDRESRLLHLLASIKLYNIYGYETQIESVKEMPNLTEEEKEIAKEIFLIRAEEARGRNREDEAREFEQLAERVMLGRPLVEPAQKNKTEESPIPGNELRAVPRKPVEPVERPVTYARPAFDDFDIPLRQRRGRKKRRVSRLFISFLLVFGLAAVLIAGMLGYYARKQGIELSNLFANKPPAKNLGPIDRGRSPSAVAQVIGVEELGFKVWGAGVANANREAGIISQGIESQLAGLREMYERVLQEKPDLMGSVTLQLTISPSGSITKVQELAARIKDNDFKQSVIEEASKWHFLESNSGLVKVNYPLLFIPPGMDIATLIKWEQGVGPKNPESVENEEPKERKPLIARGKTSPEGNLGNPTGSGDSRPGQPQPASPARPPAPESQTRVIKVVLGTYEVLRPTSVYSEPREDSQRVAQINTGTKVNVVDVQGDWLEVRSRQGRPPGFIKKDSAMPWGSR